MNTDLQARCREVLLEACKVYWNGETCSWDAIALDDAARVMAAAIEGAIGAYEPYAPDYGDVAIIDALAAAAKEGERE